MKNNRPSEFDQISPHKVSILPHHGNIKYATSLCTTNTSSIECLWVRVTVLDVSLVIGSFYLPPDQAADPAVINVGWVTNEPPCGS